MERKVKYDYTFKLECVELVLKGYHSLECVSTLKSTSKSSIRNWVCNYKAYGAIGLLARKNASYPVDFKLKVLRAMQKQSLSLREARLKFNIPTNSIIVKWKKDFANFGVQSLKSKPRGRPKSMSNFKRKKHKSDQPLTREEELLKENERLRCEIDLLKKLQALTQAKKNLKP